MIPESEWKATIKDSKEKEMERERKMPPNIERYMIF